MSENFIERCFAICSECEHVTKSGTNDKFLSAFFLPAMCTNCGAKMQKHWPYDRTRPRWLVSYCRYKRIPAVRKLSNPLTWLRRAQWLQTEDVRVEA